MPFPKGDRPAGWRKGPPYRRGKPPPILFYMNAIEIFIDGSVELSGRRHTMQKIAYATSNRLPTLLKEEPDFRFKCFLVKKDASTDEQTLFAALKNTIDPFIAANFDLVCSMKRIASRLNESGQLPKTERYFFKDMNFKTFREVS